MNIKRIFELLKSLNELANLFSNEEHFIKVYFDEYDSNVFHSYKEFYYYIKKEYTKEYIDALMYCEGQACLDHSVYFSFVANNVKCSVELYIY